MSTAVFELFGKLAVAASAAQHDTPSAISMAPPQMLLPTDEECGLYGHKKPIVFFYEPRLAQHSAAAAAVAASTTAAPTSSFLQHWPSEMTTAQLTSPHTTVHALRVTTADDEDGSSTSTGTGTGSGGNSNRSSSGGEDGAAAASAAALPAQEVWVDWPQTIRGWQLCAMSHLCAVVHTPSAPAAAAAVTSLPTSSPSASAGGAIGPRLYLLASRYELVGTTAVYERYLLLTPPTAKGAAATAAAHRSNNARDRSGTAAQTSISVAELRTLRRVACLCRCFTTAAPATEPSQRRMAAAAAAARAADTSAPPRPLADYLLQLVPVSLQHTFCLTVTPLLSAMAEERCQSWALATAAASRHKLCPSQPSCSTEPVNTSGALSDAGHTSYVDSSAAASQSRDRSTSAVRVVDSYGVGFSEDPRSAVSTPARPPLGVSRHDDQREGPSAARQSRGTPPPRLPGTAAVLPPRGAAPGAEEHLPSSQRWNAMALLRLLDRSFYDAQVPAGWRRWRYASNGILCRSLVVDSLDGIVRYIYGSRLAFYTAVAFLDRFIATTVDPVANFLAYQAQLRRARARQEMDCRMLTVPGCSPGATAATAAAAAELHYDCGMADVQPRDICAFLTQVIVVCIMLGGKTVDLYPPRLRSLMGCVEDTAPITEAEFVVLEFHVLLTLSFPVHPVTLYEAVSTLLTFSASDALYTTLTASHATRRLLDEHQDRGHLVESVDHLLAESAEEEAAAAVTGRDGAVATPPSARTALGLHAADRRALNAWLRLRLFTLFICDEVIRADAVGPSSSASSSSGGSTPRHGGARGGAHPCRGDEEHDASAAVGAEQVGDVSVLQFAPALVAAAALVTATELLRMPLPAPLLRLLPARLQARFREATASQEGRSGCGAGSSPAASSRRPSSGHPKCDGANEESNMRACSSTEDGEAASALGSLRLTTGPGDDHFTVLLELSLMVEQELCRIVDDGGAPGPLATPGTTPTSAQLLDEDEEALTAGVAARSPCPVRPYAAVAGTSRGGATATTLRRGSSASSVAAARARPASPAAVAMFGHILAQVSAIHHRSRDSCPPVLLQRYQSLFRDAA